MFESSFSDSERMWLPFTLNMYVFNFSVYKSIRLLCHNLLICADAFSPCLGSNILYCMASITEFPFHSACLLTPHAEPPLSGLPMQVYTLFSYMASPFVSTTSSPCLSSRYPCFVTMTPFPQFFSSVYQIDFSLNCSEKEVKKWEVKKRIIMESLTTSFFLLYLIPDP